MLGAISMISSMREQYRTLYRLTLWFGHDQRIPLRAYLRSRATQEPAPAPHTLAKTVEFADAAARRHGLERRIVAGLAQYLASVHRVEKRNARPALKSVQELNKSTYMHMVQQLNESHGICL